jgi:glycosyltransferase involved in cell wall biosynthesis
LIISQLTPRFKPSIGGIETLVYETSRFLVSNGNSVKVFTSRLTGVYEQKLKRKEIIEGIKITRSSAFPLLPIKGGMLNVMPRMLFDVLTDESDIYHSYGAGSFPSIVAHLKKKQKKPIVLTPLLYSTTEGKTAQTLIDKLTKNILNSADKLIAQTKSEKHYLQNLGINDDKIEIIPLYANPERFSKYKISSEEFRKKYSLKKNVILYVGRIEIWQKGLDFLVESLSKVKKDFDASLIISGEDWGSKDKLLKLAEKLNVLENLKFFDPKDERFLGEAYHASDMLVLPSNFEPFGTVLLEAMCCGTPVVGTRVGGIVDVISDEETGKIVPPKNSDALADAISDILGNEQKKRQFGENGIQKMKEYSVPVLGKKYLKIYSELLK